LDEIEKSETRSLAFKIMYDQVRRNPSILWAPFRRDYVIVHLTRKNLLHVVMSRLLARETRVYHSKTKINQPVITADPAAVMSMLKRLEWQTKLARLAIRLLPCRKIEVCYEDLVAHPESEIDRMLRLADIPSPGHRTRQDFWTKTNVRAPSQVFGNYDIIAGTVSKSRYAWMLEGIPNV
jgi:LPS sulfotransferase NodH